MEAVADTQTNLENAFQTEKAVNRIHYPEMIRQAEEDGEETAALIFSQARNVEAQHAKLYKKALNHLVARCFTEYYICTVCGYTVEREPPEKCPICGAAKTKFEKAV